MTTRPLRSRAFVAAASMASVVGVLGTLYMLDIPALLQQRVRARTVQPRGYHTGENVSLARFRNLVEQVTLKETYPLAETIEQNVPIYDCTALDLRDPRTTDRWQDELYHILVHGPGVLVLRNFFADTAVVDATNAVYEAILAAEEHAKEDGGNGSAAKGDHFAPASANSRIWNSFSKHCLQDPESFLEYYSNPLFRTVSEAYLGPAYKITTQVNVVRAGGQAQVCHRDYHLGFQTAERTAQWPKAVHTTTQHLTLQGAVAHTDMPVESGPTRFLPYSQLFEEGFMAYRMPEFNDYFLQNYVSLALRKGDAVFFSPALFHAAGANTLAGFDRSANLVQVSSAFGKTMEMVDTLPLIEKTFLGLKARFAEARETDRHAEVDAFISAVAEGYPFPTNLDRRPPGAGSMAPISQQDVLWNAVREDWSLEKTIGVLTKMRQDDAS